MNTRASVIIPTHRGAHRLPALLDALAVQDFVDEWEVIVAVDGIRDETPNVLASYTYRLPLRVITTEDPQGLCRTLNQAFAAASGSVLIRCDDDLTPAPDMVSRHLRWHDGSDSALGIIGATRDVFPNSPYARCYGRPANQRQLRTAYSRGPDSTWIHWAAHNSISRATWTRVGGFDKRFVYGQDSELGLRLHKLGVHIIIDPALEIPHRGPAQSAAIRASRAFTSGASRRLRDRVHPATPTPTPPTTGIRGQAWRRVVDLASFLIRDQAAFAKIGAAADRFPDGTPDGLRAKTIAFAVEAAAQSGYRFGPTDLSVLRAQKLRELERERAGIGE